MNEEKLYMVKNDKGYYWDFNNLGGLWKLSSVSHTATFSEATAKNTAEHYGGHVVALIEEHEKVVLTKEQAEIVDDAHGHMLPACYISKQPDDEELLMNAYVNGYTVAKEKRYLLPMEGFGEHLGYAYMEDGIWYINTAPSQDYAVKHGYTVTKDEYDSAPNWVKILKPVEVTDDAN